LLHKKGKRKKEKGKKEREFSKIPNLKIRLN